MLFGNYGTPAIFLPSIFLPSGVRMRESSPRGLCLRFASLPRGPRVSFQTGWAGAGSAEYSP